MEQWVKWWKIFPWWEIKISNTITTETEVTTKDIIIGEDKTKIMLVINKDKEETTINNNKWINNNNNKWWFNVKWCNNLKWIINNIKWCNKWPLLKLQNHQFINFLKNGTCSWIWIEINKETSWVKLSIHLLWKLTNNMLLKSLVC